MKIWTNTKTLDGYLDELDFTNDKEIAEVALIGGKTLNINDFPRLKLIYRTGVSRDNLPFDDAKEKNVRIELPCQNVQDIIFRETADFTCHLILKMFYEKVGSVDPWVKLGRKSLSGKKVLVIGTGKIGSMVASKMSHFCNVQTYDILNNTVIELNQFISDADCITLHIPNTKENNGFFNDEKLSLMKKNSILINTARGPIVKENDLFEHLRRNRIKAAFDVYWNEPYTGKLKDFINHSFFMTPHIASTCDEFLENAALDFKRLLKEVEEC